MTADLDIYLQGRHVAHTEPVSRGAKLRIVYEPDVEDHYPEETALLSCSIPTGRRSEPAAAYAFLEGLLPEGRALELMASRLRDVSLDGAAEATNGPYDAARILSEYGRECAGAVTLVAKGEQAPGLDGSFQPLEDHDVATILGVLPTRPLGTNLESDIRMSLAGAQQKVLLTALDGRWHEPHGGAPSTHILKPTGGWASSADNECVVMNVASRAGLTSAQTWVTEFDGLRTFVTERFDRTIVEGTVQRQHQEDFCQAMKRRPKDKYRIGRVSGAPVTLLRQHSSQPDEDTRVLFRQMAFRAIVGDEDGHGKNYGLMLNDGSVTVAPLYDSLCTLAYPELSRTVAMPIGGRIDLSKLDLHSLVVEGHACGLPTDEARLLVEDLALAMRDALNEPSVAAVDEHALDIVGGLISTRISRLLQGEQMGLPETTFGSRRQPGHGNLDQMSRRSI